MLKVDNNLVVVVYNSSAYYHYNHNVLKKILSEGGCKNNKDALFDKMSLQDIDKNIKQVLIGDNIVEHLLDKEPVKGNYTCKIKTNEGWAFVKIPEYFFKNVK